MSAVDYFASATDALTSPIDDGAAVTPDDSNDLTFVTRAIIVGVAGNVKVTLAKKQTAVTLPLLAGILYPLRVSRVWNTSTTATGIVALQ